MSHLIWINIVCHSVLDLWQTLLIHNNGCVQNQRWKSPLHKLRVERVNKNIGVTSVTNAQIHICTDTQMHRWMDQWHDIQLLKTTAGIISVGNQKTKRRSAWSVLLFLAPHQVGFFRISQFISDRICLNKAHSTQKIKLFLVV